MSTLDEKAVMPFDVCGPLPTGVTVLEASAGTGKTYTISALAARYVAEGVPLDQLLLVTFTRMATGELRERVRHRLVITEQALSGTPPAVRDEVVDLLAQGAPEEVALRRARLTRAVSDFDAATIATTHGFCQEVLGGLGVAGDVEPDTTFVEDLDDLLEEVVDDLYVRRFHRRDTPDFDRRQALLIARAAVYNPDPDAPIEPADAPDHSVEAMRVRLARAIREELELRKRRMGVMTYDDLLTRLHRTLHASPAAAARLRARYRVVLVDEFQDTDPIQWAILRRAFGGADSGVTLVLIGDPKQAIYAFRGADVYAYLEAAQAAATRHTLTTNWRSDQPLIDAYDALFGGTRLGHEGIVYREVRAAPANRTARLHGAPVDASLRLRVVPRDHPFIRRTPSGFASKPSAREHVARDLAADLARLLNSPAEIEIRREDGTTTGRGRLRPGDVAVLVPTNRTAAQVRDALEEVDVPAVINGAGSVFATGPARDWLALLEALERPASEPRARAAALTPFLGWSPDELACATDDATDDLHRRLHRWAGVLRRKGVASLLELVTLSEGLPGRMLSAADGERALTDLRHVGQLLHGAATSEQFGVTALTSWLRERIAAAADETGDEDRSRRLESDAEAVQVLTIHRSKGLEFPVVYLPFLWEPGYIPSDQPVSFHDPDAGDRRTVDVGLGGPKWKAHERQHEVEQRGEDLRLAYVALTRARHQAVVWWAGSYDTRHSPLTRLLFSRDDDGNVAPSGASTPTDEAATARLEQLAAIAPGCVSVEEAIPARGETWGEPPVRAGTLEAAHFDRRLDRGWRRTSYSDITAAAHEAWVASEPEQLALRDEPEGPGPAATVAPPTQAGLEEAMLRAVPSPWADLPVGVHVGTLVHRVMEAVDFAASDLDAELAGCVAAAQARRPVDLRDDAVAVGALRATLETPLGPLLGGMRLRDVARADRLDELAFELPLVGGDDPTGRLTVDAIADVLREHLPAGDPLAGYAARLDDPALRRDVRGYLTGSIDLVLRTCGPDGAARFAIADYKTNWLAPPGDELSAWHHRPAALGAEMEHAHYGLQALLYAAALHRYLRWRVPGYDPARNLAGVLYLFVRGMSGPDTPVVDGAPCGVFAWRPPADAIVALSDVLDRGRTP
ncbi:UvrD-helicase domain-containing protein [Capillimicrobium parvum]|uniref:RecBCD enzyme subunit RecB n=1 Tax=Capillimicrobium parvum TaxID=2884022 RepID=A0A9E7C384_9ACTN|nr:UvrD-helicase domain-containing protein [Capillimicrobium parvum]UGS38489.1 RecBCD enzyme subunit RecB [Capillimicrobium parvum]